MGDSRDCDCRRCRSTRYEISRRDPLDTVFWSFGLFQRYPGIPAIFALVAVSEVFLPASAGGAGLFLGVLFGRGYVNVCAAEDLGREEFPATQHRYLAALKRIPVVAVAFVLAIAVFLLFGVVFVSPVAVVLELYQFDSFLTAGIGIGALLLFAAFGLLVVYSKLFFLQEACFIDGAGVIGSLRRSWGAVGIKRIKILVVAGSFSLVIGLILFRTGDEGALRALSSVATTAIYSAVFSHLYVERTLESMA